MKTSERDIVLLMLGIDSDREGFGGITRLQKLLFLLQMEADAKEVDSGFEFAPYKAGPYSAKLYDDLEFLENLGLVESSVSGDAVEAEAVEIDLLSFDELMGDSADPFQNTKDGFGASDAYEERRFTLSDRGRERVTKLLDNESLISIVDGIRRIKGKFSKYSLNDLLYYIYTKYPEWTTESEIKDQVMRKRR